MKKMSVFIGGTVGGYIGWYAGDRFGLMTAFILSMVGTGIGGYYANKFMREYY